jgi:hypothetical protein
VDNTHKYGFRWSRGANSRDCPQGLRFHVATGQDDVDDGAVSISLRPGDPVKMVSTGGMILSLTTEAVFGIVVGIAPYWDGTRMIYGKKLPNQTAWGTVEERRSFVYVVPAHWGLWEIDVDDKVTATTLATYRALINENTEHTVPGGTATGVAPTDSADPYLDISLHAVTATLGWRIMDVSETLDNIDFSGSYVKLIVAVNECQYPGMPASGSIVAGL